MTDELDLSGAELLVFALIYSFPDGFHGSQGYVGERTKNNERTVRRALTSLEGKGLLIKKIIISPDGDKAKNIIEYRTKCPEVSDKMSGGGGQNVQKERTKCPGVADKMSANNKDDNKVDNKDDNSARGSAIGVGSTGYGGKKKKSSAQTKEELDYIELAFANAFERSYGRPPTESDKYW